MTSSLARPTGLTDGEWDVYRLRENGRCYSDIGAALGLEFETVKKRLYTARRKLNVEKCAAREPGVLGSCRCGLRIFAPKGWRRGDVVPAGCNDCTAARRAEDYLHVGAEGGPALRCVGSREGTRANVGAQVYGSRGHMPRR